jgi:hypothetical protein
MVIEGKVLKNAPSPKEEDRENEVVEHKQVKN